MPKSSCNILGEAASTKGAPGRKNVFVFYSQTQFPSPWNAVRQVLFQGEPGWGLFQIMAVVVSYVYSPDMPLTYRLLTGVKHEAYYIWKLAKALILLHINQLTHILHV